VSGSCRGRFTVPSADLSAPILAVAANVEADNADEQNNLESGTASEADKSGPTDGWIIS